jgi:WD40 repeat protein
MGVGSSEARWVMAMNRWAHGTPRPARACCRKATTPVRWRFPVVCATVSVRASLISFACGICRRTRRCDRCAVIQARSLRWRSRGRGEWVVSGSVDQTVRLWHRLRADGVEVFSGHEGLVTSVAITGFGFGCADRRRRGRAGAMWDLRRRTFSGGLRCFEADLPGSGPILGNWDFEG